MQYTNVSIIVPVVAGLSLAAIGALILLTLIGIRADRKERDTMKGFDDHLNNYGNPGMEPDENQVIDWNIHNDHAMGDELPCGGTMAMIPVEFSYDEIAVLREIVNGTDVWSIIVAYDPIDQAMKFKVNGSSWGPPMGTAHIQSL